MRRRQFTETWILTALIAVTLGCGRAVVADALPPIRLFRSTSLSGWEPTITNGQTRWVSPAWQPEFLWDEAVPSWNVGVASAWEFELRSIDPTGNSSWYSLGHWCSDTNQGPRTSVVGQSDAQGRVATDTLILTRPATALQARLTLGPKTTTNDFRQFTVSVLASKQTWPEPDPYRLAWGRQLAVPVRSQADFPEGVQSWCSPTSVTMVVAWWLSVWGIPSQPMPIPSVPETARDVFDPGWPGAGNWAFNVAFLGQTPGLRSAVVRLAGTADLERWIASGWPVVTSVSYTMLKGGLKPEIGDGHLVVVRGFSAEGDVLINDPGVRTSRVSQTIPRAAFRAAWAQSRNTAYVVWPIRAKLPAGGDGRW